MPGRQASPDVIAALTEAGSKSLGVLAHNIRENPALVDELRRFLFDTSKPLLFGAVDAAQHLESDEQDTPISPETAFVLGTLFVVGALTSPSEEALDDAFKAVVGDLDAELAHPQAV